MQTIFKLLIIYFLLGFNLAKADGHSSNEKFLLIVSNNTGISINEISYISPLWTYKLLTLLSVIMIIGEFFALN